MTPSDWLAAAAVFAGLFIIACLTDYLKGATFRPTTTKLSSSKTSRPTVCPCAFCRWAQSSASSLTREDEALMLLREEPWRWN